MKKNLVVIGYGSIGKSHHVPQALKSDVVNLKGVYDIDPLKKEELKINGIYAYNSLEEVLCDKDVDIVTVAIPNDQHKEVVIKCLKAHKNVICEKPVALSINDLDDMINCANENGVLFTVHQNRRFDVDYLAVKKIKEDGNIGELLDIESRIQGSRGIPSDWRSKKEYGGGMLYDWGVHLIDQVLQLKKEDIKKIYCEVDNITNKEVDDGFKLHITFSDSTKALIEVGTYNFIQMPRFYVRGTKGTMLLNDWKEKAKIVECTSFYEPNVSAVKNAAGVTKTMAPRDEKTTKSYEIERLQSDSHDFYRNFCNAIDGKEEQMVTHKEMKRVLRVILLAFKSAKGKLINEADYDELNKEFNMKGPIKQLKL